MPGVERLRGTVVSTVHAGQEVRFFVENPDDLIQQCHWRGAFYETEELDLIAGYCRPGGVFVDIGANVGNHSLYAAKFLHPSQVIPFEPMALAAAVLRINVMLNAVQGVVDLSHLGIGLSDAPGWATASEPIDNLGATRLTAGSGPGGLPLVRGDDLLAGRRADFIKVDAEGMELAILSGLHQTILRWRPVVYVEVETVHQDAFARWLSMTGYRAVHTLKRYDANTNYLIQAV